MERKYHLHLAYSAETPPEQPQTPQQRIASQLGHLLLRTVAAKPQTSIGERQRTITERYWAPEKPLLDRDGYVAACIVRESSTDPEQQSRIDHPATPERKSYVSVYIRDADHQTVAEYRVQPTLANPIWVRVDRDIVAVSPELTYGVWLDFTSAVQALEASET
jgi:hypothetical protein